MGTATEPQLDLLRELANIGAGHAATALSKLMGGNRFLLDVPTAFETATTGPWDQLDKSQNAWVVTAFEFKGELQGALLWILPRSVAHLICASLLHYRHSGKLDENERSAMGEVANILASSCLAAIEAATGFKLRPSIPLLCEGALDSVTKTLSLSSGIAVGGEMTLSVHVFDSPAKEISGHIFILPRANSVQALYQRMGVA